MPLTRRRSSMGSSRPQLNIQCTNRIETGVAQNRCCRSFGVTFEARLRVLIGRVKSFAQEEFVASKFLSSHESHMAHLRLLLTITYRYEDALLKLMYEYGPRPKLPLSEIEVFIGNILTKTGSVKPRQRELCMSMKERFEDVLASIVTWMTGKDPGDDKFEEDKHPKPKESALGVSIACLWLALNEKAKSVEAGRKGKVRLRSFGYVAAIVCLKEMQRAGM